MRRIKDGKYLVRDWGDHVLFYHVYYEKDHKAELSGAFPTRALARMYAKFMNDALDEANIKEVPVEQKYRFLKKEEVIEAGDEYNMGTDDGRLLNFYKDAT